MSSVDVHLVKTLIAASIYKKKSVWVSGWVCWNRTHNIGHISSLLFEGSFSYNCASFRFFRRFNLSPVASLECLEILKGVGVEKSLNFSQILIISKDEDFLQYCKVMYTHRKPSRLFMYFNSWFFF
jgi:hypothetical protein